jgi:ribosomal protein S17E
MSIKNISEKISGYITQIHQDFQANQKNYTNLIQTNLPLSPGDS